MQRCCSIRTKNNCCLFSTKTTTKPTRNQQNRTATTSHPHPSTPMKGGDPPTVPLFGLLPDRQPETHNSTRTSDVCSIVWCSSLRLTEQPQHHHLYSYSYHPMCAPAPHRVSNPTWLNSGCLNSITFIRTPTEDNKKHMPFFFAKKKQTIQQQSN